MVIDCFHLAILAAFSRLTSDVLAAGAFNHTASATDTRVVPVVHHCTSLRDRQGLVYRHGDKPRHPPTVSAGTPMAGLHFYYAAMNAGKSTHLLQANYNYLERGLRTLLLKPSEGERPGDHMGGQDDTTTDAEYTHITSRIGIQAMAHRLSHHTQILTLVQQQQRVIEANGTDRLACVLVDEAQFLKRDQVWQLTDVVDRMNIPVLCYGLRTDFRGDLFEGSQYLMAWADRLVELRTVGPDGRKATMNLRHDAHGHGLREGPQVLPGGNERYTAVTRRAFKDALGL